VAEAREKKKERKKKKKKKKASGRVRPNTWRVLRAVLEPYPKKQDEELYRAVRFDWDECRRVNMVWIESA
jgi:hypothetical protein